LDAEEALVATPEEKRSTTLDEAVEQLSRDPSQPVRVRVGDLDVQIRVISGRAMAGQALGDLMAAAGPWEGETTEELIRVLREGRDDGSSIEPPDNRAPANGPYASLLASAGSAESLADDVASNKDKHLADIYTPNRSGR
jgi:hypothetical protein